MSESPDSAARPEAGWRIIVGAVLFGLSILGPVGGVPLVVALGLGASTTATVTGVLIGASELLGLAAVAVMGKPGYAFIKSRLVRWLRRHGPPARVGRGRYRMGLVLFCLPLIWGWLAPYLAHVVSGAADLLALAVAGDAMLIASLFVLGGDFWDKLRALFVHEPATGRAVGADA